MSPELREAAGGIRPVPLQEYLRSRGWQLQEDLTAERGFASYVCKGVAVDVPQRLEFADYARRVAEVLALVAEMEGRSPFALLDDLIQPPGDVLGVRVSSEAARSGTLPLIESLRLREAAKNLILASAHSALSPQAYFPRMSRADAAALLASVREGQNQHGSFVARFIVPVDPAVGEQVTMDEDPFGRRVMRLLMRALDAVHRVRSLGAYDDLLGMGNLGVSANLLAALFAMRGAIGAGALDFSIGWARNRRPPERTVSRIVFPAEALEGLDAVADRMKSEAQTKGFLVEGYVTRLDRSGDADGPGDVIVVPSGPEEEPRRVSVHLDAQAYQEAIRAHERGEAIRVLGTLQKVGRRWTLTDASGFEIMPAPADDADPSEPE